MSAAKAGLAAAAAAAAAAAKEQTRDSRLDVACQSQRLSPLQTMRAP